MHHAGSPPLGHLLGMPLCSVISRLYTVLQSEEFQHAYKDKGRMSVLVKSVPLFLVLTEDT